MILVPTSLSSASIEQIPQTAMVRQEPRSARADAASEILLRAIGGKPSPELADDLAAQGAEAIPILLRVLARRGMPVGSDPERKLVLEATPEILEHVLTALASMPREPLIQSLRASVASTDFEDRAACMRVLGRIGTNEHLHLLADLGAPLVPAGLLPTNARGAFQEALARILARDPKAFSRFKDLYAEIPPALIFPMIRAAEEEAPVRTIELLAGLLGVRSEADPFLLSEMARLADQSSVPTPPEVCAEPRRYLADGDLQRLKAAVTVAGALDDHEAVPELTRLLGHSDVQVARGARNALKKIARKDLGRVAGPWTTWYRNESEWWRTKSASIAQDLAGRDPVKAAAAIMELGARRIRRGDAALMLAEGLRRSEPDLVRTCCLAIGHLRSALAIPALETAAQHQDLKVREAAGNALAQIRPAPGA